ncbi:MAG: NAD(P)/FAD-dependent oxidoreductase [Bacteroidetes bacterium]|nr:NAD(P)/FAD-dependent oxidoreductase [Bacteroidota bacterium]
MKKNITILGAGLVGSLLSIYLAKRGHKINVYERRPDMRKEKISAGKSINLALSDRGWRGLERTGIADEIRKVAIPMYGRMIHHVNGEVNFQPYGEKDQAIWSVSRGGLNIELMNLAERNPGVKIFFDERCTGVDLENSVAKFENQLTKKNSSVESDVIFGADGAFSAARHQLQLSTDRFQYSQYYIEHGYKELNIPAAENGEWNLEKNALHIWPRGGYMLIALPNIDGSFTCTLFFPFEGGESFSKLDTKEKTIDFFTRVFPDAVPLMPTLADDFFRNPTGSLVTVRCFPWSYNDTMCLIGDAAHAIVPFFGQGMNCGFEDCTILQELMDENETDWEKLFKDFEQSRKPNSDAIAQLALENFIEMRDLVGDKKFLLRKKIEAWFHEKHPDQWLSLYSQVTFSAHIPYSVALSNGKRQDEIMKKIMEMEHIEERWNSEEVEKTMLNLLSWLA